MNTNCLNVECHKIRQAQGKYLKKSLLLDFCLTLIRPSAGLKETKKLWLPPTRLPRKLAKKYLRPFLKPEISKTLNI